MKLKWFRKRGRRRRGRRVYSKQKQCMKWKLRATARRRRKRILFKTKAMNEVDAGREEEDVMTVYSSLRKN